MSGIFEFSSIVCNILSHCSSGLDEVILPYVRHFASNKVDGKRLLQLSADTLPALRVTKVGHQEIILQAVELLRNIVSCHFFMVLPFSV